MGSESPTNALLEIAQEGDLEQLQRLIDTEPEPLSDKTVQELLVKAAQQSQHPIVEFLLSKYDLKELEEAVIRAVIHTGSIPLFTTILSKYPSAINLQLGIHGSPLVFATMCRKPRDFIKFMLEAGADPNAEPGVQGITPLGYVAAFYKDTSVADLLLQYGAEHLWSGCLESGASTNNFEIVRFLLERGANHETDRSWLPGSNLGLHVAASKGFNDIIKLFLEYGAVINARNNNGRTPLDVVWETEKEGKVDLSETKELLLCNGGEYSFYEYEVGGLATSQRVLGVLA